MERRQKIVAAALAGVGCSSVLRIGVYTTAVIRPVDRVPRMKSFYFGNPRLSTCALFVVQCLANAGCQEPECVAPYIPEGGVERNAMVDIQRLAKRSAAWVPVSKTMAPPKAADVWVIDNGAGEAHTGVCTSDAVVQADGSWLVDTVEGGQMPVDASGNAVAGQGSSAQLAFAGPQARHFVWDGLHWMLGQRWLLGYASADLMPVPDDASPDSSGQHVAASAFAKSEAVTARELPLPFDPTSVPPPPPEEDKG
jgi:hypothetical protein